MTEKKSDVEQAQADLDKAQKALDKVLAAKEPKGDDVSEAEAQYRHAQSVLGDARAQEAAAEDAKNRAKVDKQTIAAHADQA